MLIQFQAILVLVLVLEGSFAVHRRNFGRLCQAEWRLTNRHLTANQAPPLLGTDTLHERRNYSVDNDFSQTYCFLVKQNRLDLEKDRLNTQPFTNC